MPTHTPLPYPRAQLLAAMSELLDWINQHPYLRAFFQTFRYSQICACIAFLGASRLESLFARLRADIRRCTSSILIVLVST